MIFLSLGFLSNFGVNLGLWNAVLLVRQWDHPDVSQIEWLPGIAEASEFFCETFCFRFRVVLIGNQAGVKLVVVNRLIKSILLVVGVHDSQRTELVVDQPRTNVVGVEFTLGDIVVGVDHIGLIVSHLAVLGLDCQSASLLFLLWGGLLWSLLRVDLWIGCRGFMFF